MKKKLTAQGPKDRKSHTVTLPKEWVIEQGLDKSKEVELNIVSNKIIISSYKEIKSEISINGDDYAESMTKVLQGLYRSGVNEIKIYFKKDILGTISDIIDKKLISYEIVEQKDDYIIIKDIMKESEEDFKVVFRRIFLLVLELSKCNDKNQLNILDRNIKKLINYCQRILMKKGHAEYKKIPLYYLILDRLDKLSDEFKWLLGILLSKKKTSTAMKELNNILRVTYELFYSFEPRKFSEYQYKSYLLKNKLKLKDKVDRETLHMHNIARILNSLYGDIFILKFDENR